MRYGLACLLVLLPALAAATVIHVPGDQPAIRMGITAASTGDTVLVAAGTWSGSLNVNLNLYGKAITVLGAGPGETVIDCGGTARGFLLLGGETPATVIEGFSIVDGWTASGEGGGIRIDTAAATLRDLRIEGCSAPKGGAISVKNGSGTTSMSDLVLAANTASSGGGIYSENSALALERLSLVGNSASSYGAALRPSGGSLQLARSIIAFSSGQPAVDGSVSAADFTCCDFYYNQAGDFADPGLVVVGQSDNIAVDPVFCDAAGGDYGLNTVSPCLPTGNACGERIGAFVEDCDDLRLFISGHCATALGQPVPATLNYPGGVAYASSGGSYLLWVLPGWSGTITPSYAGEDFLPPSRSYSDLQASESGQDFQLDHATLIRVPADLPTLRAAVATALAGDTVLVAPGTYSGTDDADLDFGGKNIVLISEAGAASTILEGGHGEYFGMAFRAGNEPATVVDGFTLRGFSGYSTGAEEGALICYQGSAPTLRNLRIEDNQAPIGGYDYTRGSGLYSSDASPTLIDCRFSNNRATYGGAVRLEGGSPRFIGVEFVGNWGAEGGAVGGSGGNAHFEDCRFIENRARVWGDEYSCYQSRGGAADVSGDYSFVNCLFVANRADSCFVDMQGSPDSEAGAGGAIFASAGATITNCTFVDNVALSTAVEVAAGATLHLAGSGAVIERNILVGSWGGGAVAFCEAGAAPASVTCNLFWSNTGGNAGGDCADPVGVDGNFEADPHFCDAGAGDFTLDEDSPGLPAHNACGQLIGAFGQGCGATAAETPPAAAGLAIGSYPNPFNPSTTIRFTLPAAAVVTLSIHDLAGRCLATLIAGQRLAAGAQSVSWDGSLAAGGRATSGVYLVKLAAGDRTAAHKLILIK